MRSRATGIAIAAAAVALASLPASGQDTEKDKPQKIVVKFTADKVVLGADLKTAKLSGHVKVTIGEVSISCDKVALAYSGGKQVASFAARGKVRLVMADIEATGDELDYDALERSVVMRGSCRVRSKSVDLSGASISLDLDTRAVSIEKASGTIDIGGQTF